MTFTRVNDQKTCRARRIKRCLAGTDRSLQACHVIAERFAKTARFKKIALHVDDDERGPFELNGERLRLGGDLRYHSAAHAFNHHSPLSTRWQDGHGPEQAACQIRLPS